LDQFEASMIEVKNISKRFGGFTAIDDISFKVEKGETVAFLGTSGCGKTTLLKMVNRLIEPSSGEIRVDGAPIAGQPAEELRKKMGYVFQNIGLFPHYTIEENIAIVPRLLDWPQPRVRERVMSLLEKLHLPPGQYGGSYPHELSGGQQQRVGIARALAAYPPILLMDEPFGALDPITRSHVRRDFRELDELKAKTIILVTHDVQEAWELADRIFLMDKGRIVQAGRPEELLSHPVNTFARDFFEDQRFQLEVSLMGAGDYPALIQAFNHFKNRPH
jgi:osmoprotectant transport system ATP-binding protein